MDCVSQSVSNMDRGRNQGTDSLDSSQESQFIDQVTRDQSALVERLNKDSRGGKGREELQKRLVRCHEPGREAFKVALEASRLLVDVTFRAVGGTDDAEDACHDPGLEGGRSKERDGKTSTRDVSQTNRLEERMPVRDNMIGSEWRETWDNIGCYAHVQGHDHGRHERRLLASKVEGRRGRRHFF